MDMNDDPRNTENPEPEWASDEEVRAVLDEAGIEPDVEAERGRARGGLSPHGRPLDEVARDAVVADSDMPLVRGDGPTRAEAMRGARRYDRWRRAGGGKPWWERHDLGGHSDSEESGDGPSSETKPAA